MLLRRFSYSLILLVVTLHFSFAASSVKERIFAYIEQYKEIAISEMERSGIPASIKLAQGLLESDFGRSNLANNANNHFGIKCGSRWSGKTFYKKDDDYKNGRLIESCFRAYSSGEQSYIEHTEFLQDPRKAYRYGFLFNYSSTDYVAWALGLSKAGYATDPKYPDKLIAIIERYQLYQYDKELISFNEEEILVQSEEISPIEDPVTKPMKIKSVKRYRKSVVNDVSYVVAKKGDTPNSISQMYNMSVWSLLDYNERLNSRNQEIPEGERVFLNQKKRSYKSKKFHKVRSGQTMFDISQLYGISLDVLYSRNRISEGQEPKRGEKIQLKGIRLGNTAKVENEHHETEFLFVENEE